MLRLWASWRTRHQHPASLVLHFVGIPLTVAALVQAGVQLWLWRWDLWWQPVGLLVAGYLFQGLGHRIEGSEMGELMVLKRWFGWSFGKIPPQDGPNRDIPELKSPDEPK